MGKRLWIAAAIVAVVGGFAFQQLVLGPGPTDFAGGKTVSLADYAGPDPTGVPASLARLSLVQRGEYLTKAADCEVCHTAKGGAPYAGGFAFKLPFGTIYSTNITPDRETGIGAYNDAQFIAAVRQGRRRDGANLYPAMPHPSFALMTDADAVAIKAYLFSLPAVRASARANTLAFPFNNRALIGLWTAAFNRDKRFEPNTERSAEWNRGAYLSEALAHCSDCHTPRNPVFALDHRGKFAGAVTGGWYAYNISGDKESGLGGWSDAALAAYLATGRAPGHGAASGPMGEVIDHSLAHLTAGDIKAMTTYLRSVPAEDSGLPPRKLTAAPAVWNAGAQDAQGEALFSAACAGCHAWTGISPLSPNATLVGARAVNDPTATNVAQAVLWGVHRKNAEGDLVMPAFGSAYSDLEVAALANYVTARFGAKGARLKEADVAKLREQAGS